MDYFEIAKSIVRAEQVLRTGQGVMPHFHACAYCGWLAPCPLEVRCAGPNDPAWVLCDICKESHHD